MLHLCLFLHFQGLVVPVEKYRCSLGFLGSLLWLHLNLRKGFFFTLNHMKHVHIYFKRCSRKHSSPSGGTVEVDSSEFFFAGPSHFLVSSWGKELDFALLALCSELSLKGFRVAAFSLACPRHGVLLELITAETRRGTDTAKGSDMLTARR